MDVSNETIVGALALAAPLMILASIFFFRRQIALGLFVDALMIVGVGYLIVTGAAADVGATILGTTASAPASAPTTSN